mmetsp:Transcript_18801/g.37913  ORF Transcript_18801/g.37913 Transcript_18801/m.37913 type:complete len:364 (+) Transcript_18801:59-1150(+)
MKTIALSLFLSSGTAAFAPGAFSRGRQGSALYVSVVRDLINKKVTSPINDNALLEAFETLTPEAVGVRGPGFQSLSSEEPIRRSRRRNNRRRKHNFQQQAHLKADPDLDFFTLHSSAVSHLHKDMPINDIVRAIKRAQNLHDIHDIATIASFLIDHCDEHWGFGYRGSLLSRLAVAALHCGETDIASRAIETRRVYERPSMQPHESAAIVKGLMRVGQVEQAWEVLDDELRLPMQGLSLQAESSQEVLKQRAHALSSIASRHFHQGEPYVAARALSELGKLGSVITEAHMKNGDLEMPWSKLVTAATVCTELLNKNGWDVKHCKDKTVLPVDLTELVWDAMFQFPCPSGEEECSLEDYIIATP